MIEAKDLNDVKVKLQELIEKINQERHAGAA